MAGKTKKIIVAVSGGFDPINIGHVRLLKEAKKLGDELVVILNNDNWLKKKKTHILMPQGERKEILEAMNEVDRVIITNHPKNPKDMSVSQEIIRVKPDIFAKGGKRRKEMDTPEVATCRDIGCKMVFNVGPGGSFQYSSWLLDQYVKKVRGHRRLDIKKISASIKNALFSSAVRLSPELKLKTAEMVLKLMNKKIGFGLFIILGWKNKWREYTDIPDVGQDIYMKHHTNVFKTKSHKYDIGTTVNFDGAILIDDRGNIIHSGIIIEGLRPHIIADKIHHGHFRDLSEQFGFRGKVHSRHLSAITASYIFKGTTVFTVSEENNSMHIFEGGKIIYSTEK